MKNTQIINPEIAKLDKEGIKYKMYSRLYREFFEAQIPKSPSFPYGITEGDQTSIRLHNTAFNFADIVADSIEIGAAGEEIDLTNLVEKTGDTMLGELFANRGFSAGIGGNTALKIFKDKDGEYGVDIYQKLRIGGKDLEIGGKNIIQRDPLSETTSIADKNVIIEADTLKLPQNTSIGSIQFTENGMVDGDREYYHTENANVKDVDWIAKNLVAEKTLLSKGNADILGSLKANNGLTVKKDGVTLIETKDGEVYVSPSLAVKNDIKSGKYNVIKSTENGIILEASDGGILSIGSDKTKEVRLSKDLKTWNSSNTIISSNGAGNFNAGLKASHDGSTPVFSTYRSKTSDEKGVIIDNKICFLDENGVYLSSSEDSLVFGVSGSELTVNRIESDSKYKPLNKKSFSVMMNTEDDFLVFGKPIESDGFTIKGKTTRLSDRLLLLDNNIMLESDGKSMVVHGNAIFRNNLSTPKFVSGYTGEGWAIQENPITGVTHITADEMTVRRKMRIYELEVQKTTATNGSLWVSNSMKADNVHRII